jgi:hypothetical protein
MILRGPAIWKVLRVIWVEGSPTDWAAITPTASPGATRDLMYLKSISRLNPSSLGGPPPATDLMSPSDNRCGQSGTQLCHVEPHYSLQDSQPAAAKAGPNSPSSLRVLNHGGVMIIGSFACRDYYFLN